MADELAYVVETITSKHETGKFDCGEPSLNDYLKKYALENSIRKLGITYVATQSGNRRVVAYYTLASAQMEREAVPKRLSRSLPHYPVPAIRIGRLAVDATMRGKGFGSDMLVDALYRSLAISESVGAYLVIVDALNQEARSFYERLGFESFPDEPLHLFMTMKKVRGL